MKQKFTLGQEVRLIGGNSRSVTFKIIDIYWWRTTDTLKSKSQWRYTLSEIGDPEKVRFVFDYNIKPAEEVCEYEVYGDKMKGRTIKEVTYNQTGLWIEFEDGYEACFEVEGDGYSSLSYPGDTNSL